MHTLAVLVGGLVVFMAGSGTIHAATVHHHLDIALEPEKHLLIGTDRITFTPQRREAVVFELAPQASDVNVAVNDQAARFRFSRGRLRVGLTPK